MVVEVIFPFVFGITKHMFLNKLSIILKERVIHVNLKVFIVAT